MTRTRALSLDLRPATLDHLGLMAALLRHFRHYTSQTQIPVDFRQDGLEGRRFAPELETAAFRLVQEALTNIARHSESEDAIIRIWAKKNHLKIEIEDNGKGFETKKVLSEHQSNGLAGMRERVLLTGGNFEIDSRTGLGTRLTAEWNLRNDL
jgi:signal transduction histidine kinase